MVPVGADRELRPVEAVDGVTDVARGGAFGGPVEAEAGVGAEGRGVGRAEGMSESEMGSCADGDAGGEAAKRSKRQTDDPAVAEGSCAMAEAEEISNAGRCSGGSGRRLGASFGDSGRRFPRADPYRDARMGASLSCSRLHAHAPLSPSGA
eukprot:3265301-Pleurochrysis_carterae.AAC.1